MNKIIFAFIIVFLIHSCAYEPVLSNKKYDFKFESITSNVESQTNQILKSNFIDKSKKASEKAYNLYFSTNESKEIISSNKQGDPTVFKTKISVNYSLKDKNKIILNDTIERYVTYNNIEDKFELLKYEENILNNLLDSISWEVLMSINNNF